MFDEKSPPSGKESSSITDSVHQVSDFVWYDPSKESKWTRIGLTAESFRRAPGPIKRENTTGIELTEAQNDLAERETPLLPESLKPRHVRMIAVSRMMSPPLDSAVAYDVAALGGRFDWHGLVHRYWWRPRQGWSIRCSHRVDSHG